MTSFSKRAIRGVNQGNILLECFGKYLSNPYDCEKSPDGIINMGTSENKLCMEILHKKIAKVDLADFPADRHHYCDMRGTPEFRKSLALFIDRYMKTKKPTNMDQLFVFNGCGSVLEMLGHINNINIFFSIVAFAICDDGEGILVPAPYYGAFKTDLMCRMGCIAYSVELSSTPNAEYGETTPFELSVPRLELALQQATADGLKIKAIILCNPNNPLGNIYSKSQLLDYLKFADKHGLHVILDEIYMLSIHEPDATMVSGLSLEEQVINPDLLHIVWGFSKDFGISGFRCGLVHTENKELATILNSNAYFQALPTVAQYVIEQLVSDFDWLDNVYLPANRARVRKNYDFIKKELEEIGVDVLKASAGLYVWVDLRRYHSSLTKEGELKLMDLFLENGVYISPGIAFSSPEYGWFRIIISVLPEQLKLGVERVKKVLEMEMSKMPNENGADLECLVSNLQKQIRESNWLDENSAEKWSKENPQLAKEFNEAKPLNQ
eukprot:gene4768-5395_t